MGNNVSISKKPTVKITDLLKEFKSVYEEKGAADFQSQIPYLEKIADHYQAKDDWPSLLRAHALYNSCAVRDFSSESKKWTWKAYETQMKFWSSNVAPPSFEQQLRITATHQERLKDIRDRYKKRLDSCSNCFLNLQCDSRNISSGENQAQYDKILTEIPRLSQDLNNEIILFSKEIIRHAVSICGRAPCQFSVVAMGSLARGEATPYSDLEFMFILEAKNTFTISYFERLAVTMYFLIGNLGETKLKYMAIPELVSWSETQKRYYQHWFDDVTMSGFKIDGLGSWSGNIPTGNGEEKQHNHLICTVDELVKRYKFVLDYPDDKEALRGDLTAMLASTVLLYGCKALHQKLRSSIELLRPNPKRQAASRKMFKNDIQKFDFKPSSALVHRRDVKSDIYRYPSLLILDLKIVHGLHKSDPWSIISELQLRNVLSSSAADCLRFSLCCGVYMRLATYFHHNSQNESISVLTLDPVDFVAKDCWFVPRSLLVHMFIHLMPLKKAVASSQTNLNSTINSNITHRTKVNAMATVDYFCEEYHSAALALSDEYDGDSIRGADRFIEWVFVFSAIEAGNYKVAEKLLTSKINDCEADAHDYILLGRLHNGLGKYDSSLEYYTIALHETEVAHKEKDNSTAALCCNSIGHTHVVLGNVKQAQEYHKKALNMRLRLHGEKDHTDLAASYNNLGSVYNCEDDFENAAKYYRKALEMRLRIFGGRDHTDIENSYSCLASVLCSLGDYNQALMYYRKALDMWIRIFGEKEHEEIGRLNGNIGIILDYQGHYKEALDCYKISLETMRKVFGDQDLSSIAASYHNIGHALHELADYKQALHYYRTAVDMWLRIHQEKDNRSLVVPYDNIGRTLQSLGYLDEAMEHHRKACDMGLRIHGSKDHTDVARSYNHIGSVFRKQQQFKRALEYHNKALNMRLRLLGNRDHKDIATSYHDIGCVFKDQNDYKQALHYLNLALSMWLRIFDDHHPDVHRVREDIQQVQKAITEQKN